MTETKTLQKRDRGRQSDGRFWVARSNTQQLFPFSILARLEMQFKPSPVPGGGML